MKVLVTGSNGFVGKNLIAQLNNLNADSAKNSGSFRYEIYSYDVDSSEELLDIYCKECDFVVNLAGANRPQNVSEFMDVNCGFSEKLISLLTKHGNTCPVLLSSSIQASLEGRFAGSEYGISKKAGEDVFRQYGAKTGADIYIYRFPNLFGKWCRPNYNSVIATFCYNIARDIPISINDGSVVLDLAYIDDVVEEIIGAIQGNATIDPHSGMGYVPCAYRVTLAEIAELIMKFRSSRKDLSVADLTPNSFSKKLYSTYLSYLPPDDFAYPLKMNVDNRGSFTEIIRTQDRGQVSVNISKPGITKGNHWHHTKTEKFVVVKGSALIQFRRIDSDEIINYHVSGDEIKVVDIPPGYTHNIINEGEDDLVTIMWCNECFDPEKPDTYFLSVNE